MSTILGCASVTAFARAELEKGLTPTAISGFIGSQVDNRGAASDEHALSLIFAGERYDRPCDLTISKGDLAGNGDSLTTTWDNCITTSAPKVVGWSNLSRIKVRGIQVCTNNKSNHRMKGIRLYGAEVQEDGDLLYQTGYESFSRSNCKTWHAAVFCPYGQVATKLVIHSTDDEVNGLGLKCRRVRGFTPPTGEFIVPVLR